MDENINNKKYEIWELMLLSEDEVFNLIVNELMNRVSLPRNNDYLMDIISYCSFDPNKPFEKLDIGAHQIHLEKKLNIFLLLCLTNEINVLDHMVKNLYTDLNYQDAYGWTGLMNSAYQNKHETVKKLLSYPEVDINLRTKSGSDALILSVISNAFESFSHLIKEPNINVNTQPVTDLMTPLMWACELSHYPIIDILLKHPKIDKTLKDKDRKTAWDLAKIETREQFPNLKP